MWGVIILISEKILYYICYIVNNAAIELVECEPPYLVTLGTNPLDIYGRLCVLLLSAGYLQGVNCDDNKTESYSPWKIKSEQTNANNRKNILGGCPLLHKEMNRTFKSKKSFIQS